MRFCNNEYHLRAFRKAGGEILLEFADRKAVRRAHLRDLIRIKERKRPDPYMDPAVRLQNLRRVLKYCPPAPKRHWRHRLNPR